MIKKVIYAVIIFSFMLFVYSDQTAKNVPVKELENSMLNQQELNSMEKCSNRDLVEFIGIDPATCKGYFYYKGTDALSVDELLVIKLNDKSALQNARDCVENRINSQIKMFDGYGPEQVALLKSAVVSQKGNYLMYCTGSNASKYEEVFRNAL